jgi:hypothetical protein
MDKLQIIDVESVDKVGIPNKSANQGLPLDFHHGLEHHVIVLRVELVWVGF